MPNDHDSTNPAPLAAVGDWHAQWARVPEPWRSGSYRLDHQPANEVFSRNAIYLRSAKTYAFAPAQQHLADELAWWVWTCWAEGLRKIEPSMLAWWRRAIDELIQTRSVESLADLGPAEVVKCAMRLFVTANGRLPSPGNRRNLLGLSEHVHLLVSVRCTTPRWWDHDTWSLRVDPRIPRRQHEPHADRSVHLHRVVCPWLREGVRFWLRTSLSSGLLTWTTAATRVDVFAAKFGRYCQEVSVSTPTLGDEPVAVRAVLDDFMDWLREPAKHGKPISRASLQSIQSHLQSFYTFMFEHADDVASVTGNENWKSLTGQHLRLWTPSRKVRQRGNTRELTWISSSDMTRMLGYLDVLGAPTTSSIVIRATDGPIALVRGLGDPQAMRIWLLQALTGRRASEILLLDFNPLTPLPGRSITEPTDDEFVARLRYQQTKVDGIDPTILVEPAIVRVIHEQQRWLLERHPGSQSGYLFRGLAMNHRGTEPRSYRSYLDALRRLDRVHGLTDDAGNVLRFSQTHRLRHTRATELLNDGVPFHVVQRYLGHKSPEMTARYAATLAATAEAEFLKHKKVGATGEPLQLNPQDVYDMTQLSKRTDRVLPNGLCMLPPVKQCDRGNACLSCSHFVTDSNHLDELRRQRDQTVTLIEQRQADYRGRTGLELGDDNVWVHGRRREVDALDRIIQRLGETESGCGARTDGSDRKPLLQIQTRGIHDTALKKARANLPDE